MSWKLKGDDTLQILDFHWTQEHHHNHKYAANSMDQWLDNANAFNWADNLAIQINFIFGDSFLWGHQASTIWNFLANYYYYYKFNFLVNLSQNRNFNWSEFENKWDENHVSRSTLSIDVPNEWWVSTYCVNDLISTIIQFHSAII